MSKWIVQVVRKVTGGGSTLPIPDGYVLWAGYIEAETRDDAESYATELLLNGVKGQLCTEAKSLPYYTAPKSTKGNL